MTTPYSVPMTTSTEAPPMTTSTEAPPMTTSTEAPPMTTSTEVLFAPAPAQAPAPVPAPVPAATEMKDNMPSFGKFLWYIFLGVIGFFLVIWTIYKWSKDSQRDAKLYGFTNKVFSDSSSLINLTATPYM
jgi:hypothetical protein